MERIQSDINYLNNKNSPDSPKSLLRSKDITSDNDVSRMGDDMLDKGPEYLAQATLDVRASLNQVEELRAAGHAEAADRYEKLVYDRWHHFIKWFEAVKQAARIRQVKKAASSISPEAGGSRIAGGKAEGSGNAGNKSSGEHPKGGSKSGGGGGKRGSGGQSGLKRGFLG
ncbi:hypothetical protein MMC10_005166 [Thelotrema lepadinum]|nr:hypothetical protein [Thelotrema lepadinum]